MKTNQIYFGGSRHPHNINPAQIAAVVAAVVASGQAVHVGCQLGADRAVVLSCPPAALHVFAVLSVAHFAPPGAKVTRQAGGTSAPMPARYLLRSIAAFQGCSQAVFFSPGAGSLAVARECVRSGLAVFAFGTLPARVPSVSGQWQASSFMGFPCYQWQVPTQAALF